LSKIRPDKVNFDTDDFVVEVETVSKKAVKSGEITEADLEKNRVDSAANEIIENAQKKADEIINQAKKEAESIKLQANDVLNSAQNDVQKELEGANQQKEEILNSAKAEVEKQRAESANLGYQEGYKDAEEKLYEDLEEKIHDFNKFLDLQYEIKNKILKSASKDIIDIISNISKKILIKEVDGAVIEKIIHKTVALLEKKENISIILSEKYAKLLYEFQKKSFSEETELHFEDFKQFENFEILYNPKLGDDTIIVENLKERFDASISSQLDIIIRDILENTANGQIEGLEQYGENEA